MIDQMYAYGKVHETLEQVRKLEASCPQALSLALRDVSISLENGAIIDFESALRQQFELHEATDSPVTEMPGEWIDNEQQNNNNNNNKHIFQSQEQCTFVGCSLRRLE